MNEQQATRLAQAWIDAWNRHDLDAILRHYAPDVEFTSPFVSALSGEASGTIHAAAKH
jgi:ketosteroid isomerase-like protein